jgi:lysophospholipase L1-like esterase
MLNSQSCAPGNRELRIEKWLLVISLLLCSVLCPLSPAAQTAVLFSTYNFTGQVLNNPITVTALDPLFSDSESLYAGLPITLQPVGGVAATNLMPGDYRVVIEGIGQAWTITVPYTTNAVNAAAIPKRGVEGQNTFLWTNALAGVTLNLFPSNTNLNGAALPIQAGANIILSTNGGQLSIAATGGGGGGGTVTSVNVSAPGLTSGGAVTTSGTVVLSTADGSGVETLTGATNAVKAATNALGSAAYSAASAFDSVGAAQTATNGLPATAFAPLGTFPTNAPGGINPLSIAGAVASASALVIPSLLLPAATGSVGVLYYKTNWSDLSDFSYSGFTPSVAAGGYIVFPQGVNDYNQTLSLVGLTNMDENYDVEIIATNRSAPSGWSPGFPYIGKKTINPWYSESMCGMLDSVGHLDFLTLSGSSPNLYVTSGLNPFNIAQNTPILERFSQRGNVATISCTNLSTLYGNSLSVTDQLAALVGGVYSSMPNAGNFTIWNFNNVGEIDIGSIKVTTFTPTNCVAFLGDSKTVGYAVGNAAITNRFSALAAQSASVPYVNYAGPGDRTVELEQCMPYLLNYIRPSGCVLCIGRNDLNSGVNASIYETNYVLIVSNLLASSIPTHHLLNIPDSYASQAAFASWVEGAFGAAQCTDVSAGWNSATMLSADNVHPSAAGHAYIASLLNLSTELSSTGLVRFSGLRGGNAAPIVVGQLPTVVNGTTYYLDLKQSVAGQVPSYVGSLAGSGVGISNLNGGLLPIQAGANVTVTTNSGQLVIASSGGGGGGGTVTSVNVSAPGLTSGGAVTTSGTVALSTSDGSAIETLIGATNAVKAATNSLASVAFSGLGESLIWPSFAGVWPAPAGWWPLNDGSGATALDKSGNGNAMALYGAPAWSSSAPAALGRSLQLVGTSSQYGQCSGSVAGLVGGGSGLTIAFWFNVSSGGKIPYVGFSASGHRFLTYDGGSTIYLICDSGSATGFIPYTKDGLWHHFALVFDGTQSGWGRVAMYTDGQAQTVTVNTGSPPGSLDSAAQLGSFVCGADITDALYSTCLVADVRLYSTAISAADVAHLYGGGLGTILVDWASRTMPVFTNGIAATNGTTIVGPDGTIASTNYIGSGAGLTNLNPNSLYWPTNAGSLIPNFQKPYTLYSASAGFTFSAPINANLSAVNTCVCLVTNSSGSPIIGTLPASISSQGTLSVTNLAAFTFIQYGNSFTNCTFLGLK